ncbi:hypothetical protein [Microbacterium soli]|uniref:Lipoprotein n=1 Tax=Microbacterium soli TaxID=446075 RepID=A0ABP7NCT5_9MICO
MTPPTSPLRIVSALSAGLLALGMLAACTPEPQPAPAPTQTPLFATDEEAFAAAEETYSRYIAALNDTDLSDPETFEPVYAWLTGTAQGAEKESLSAYHAEKLRRSGNTDFDTFTPLSRTEDEVTANLCLDVSEVDLVDEDGGSVLQTDRATRRALKVTFVPGMTTTGLRISSNHKPETFTC